MALEWYMEWCGKFSGGEGAVMLELYKELGYEPKKNWVEIWGFIFYNDCYFIYPDWNKYSSVNTDIREGED